MKGLLKHLGSLLIASLLATEVVAAAQPPVPSPPPIAGEGYLLIDHHSGRVLAEKNADKRLEPASITKIMTAYIVFRQLAEGDIGLDDEVLISEKAWRTPGSRTYVEVGSKVSVESLLKGMIVQSGNDATVALAEYIGGTEEAFASLMNHHAQRLGMTGTHYQNSTGLPAPEHYTTAHDIAKLVRAMIDEFPDYYRWHATREYTYNGIRQYNRNRLLGRMPGVDGVKTGHTEDAGYCLVASAVEDGMRLISVVLGTDSDKARISASQALLSYGFRFYDTHLLYEAGKALTEVDVWRGEADKVTLGLRDDLYVTVPRGAYDDLDAAMQIQTPLLAPLAVSEEVGTAKITLGEKVLAERALYPLSEVALGGFWQRIVDDVWLYFAQ